MKKEIKQIFIALFFFALSDGFYYNFQELWMADNNLSTKTIGIVFSLSALLTVSTIFLCSNLINKSKLKKFASSLLIIKAIVLLLTFILNQTGLNVLIKFLIMVDYVLDVEIYACIYPMISLITQDNKLYALRSLIYTYAYYGGSLLTVLFLGKIVINLKITYNTYCLLASIFILISFLVLKKIDLKKYNIKEKENENYNALSKVIKAVKKDKITQNYLLYNLSGTISYNCVNILLILILTDSLQFSASSAALIKLATGILSGVIATIILEKLTSKNDYVNFSIKFVGRLVLYILAFLSNHTVFFLSAIIFMRLLSESYVHVTDAPYVNRFKPKDQLAFCNLNEMINYLAKSIGSLLCGIGLALGTRYIFLFALIFVAIQIVFGLKALKLRLNEKGSESL